MKHRLIKRMNNLIKLSYTYEADSIHYAAISEETMHLYLLRMYKKRIYFAVQSFFSYPFFFILNLFVNSKLKKLGTVTLSSSFWFRKLWMLLHWYTSKALNQSDDFRAIVEIIFCHTRFLANGASKHVRDWWQ